MPNWTEILLSPIVMTASGLQGAGLPSLATAGDDQVPKAPESGLPSLATTLTI